MPPYWHFCVCVCEFWGTNTGPPVCKASTLPTNSSSQLSQDILKGHFLAAVGKRQRNTCCVFFYTCCCHLGFLLKCVSHSPRCARAHWAAAGHPFPVSPSSLCEFCRIQWLYHSVLMDFLIFYHYSQAAQTISQASPVFHMNFPRECSLLFYFFPSDEFYFCTLIHFFFFLLLLLLSYKVSNYVVLAGLKLMVFLPESSLAGIIGLLLTIVFQTFTIGSSLYLLVVECIYHLWGGICHPANITDERSNVPQVHTVISRISVTQWSGRWLELA